MAVPTTPALDLFNRADSSNLGSNWTYPLRPGDDSPRVSNNTAKRSTGSPGTDCSAAYWDQAVYSGDVEVWVGNLGSSAVIQIWLQLQNENTNSYTGYGFRVDMPGNGMWVTRWLNGAVDDLWSIADHVGGAGSMWFQAKQTAPGTISLYPWADYNDGSGYRLLTTVQVAGTLGSGHIGLRLGPNGQVDSFGGGALSVLNSRSLTDSGLVSFSVALARGKLTRGLTDRAITLTEALQRVESSVRYIAEVGIVSFSETLAKRRVFALTDTGANVTGDFVSTPRLRYPTDTGLTVFDNPPVRVVSLRSMADTGVTVDPTISVRPRRGLADSAFGGAVNVLGQTTKPASPFTQDGTIRANNWPVPVGGITITKLSFYLDSGSTPMPFRGVVYADSAGAPGALLGVTPEAIAPIGANGWYDTPAVAIAAPAGQVWIGLWTLGGTGHRMFYNAPGVPGGIQADQQTPGTYTSTGSPPNPYGVAGFNGNQTEGWNATYVSGGLSDKLARGKLFSLTDTGLAFSEPPPARHLFATWRFTDTGVRIADSLGGSHKQFQPVAGLKKFGWIVGEREFSDLFK